MDAMKVKVALPDGTIKEGLDVAIDESNERWSELKLHDGAIIRVKLSVIQIVRIEGQFDKDGNPVYVVKGGPIIAVASCPDKLRKKDT